MITETNLKDVLDRLGFAEFKSGDWRKSFPEHGLDCEMRVDFRSKTLTYPSLVTVNDKTTSNFEHDENFVVFECVARLLDKGYSPEHLELEPRWQTTRGAATGGGKADIWIRTIDKQGAKQSLCIIECKTAGGEFEKAWHLMCADCDQLFSYGFEHRETQFLCLYASDFVNDSVIPQYHLVSIIDNDEYLKNLKHKRFPHIGMPQTTKLFSAHGRRHTNSPMRQRGFLRTTYRRIILARRNTLLPISRR